MPFTLNADGWNLAAASLVFPVLEAKSNRTMNRSYFAIISHFQSPRGQGEHSWIMD